jgi:hypothetical protein
MSVDVKEVYQIRVELYHSQIGHIQSSRAASIPFPIPGAIAAMTLWRTIDQATFAFSFSFRSSSAAFLFFLKAVTIPTYQVIAASGKEVVQG